jgi:hypothetical protein
MIVRVHQLITPSLPRLILSCVAQRLNFSALFIGKDTVKKSIWITLAATIMFSASVQAARAEGDFYAGGPVEERAAMMSPEKAAYQKAQTEEHQCVSEHQRDYSSACSRSFLATLRAQQNFGHFIATGDHAPQFRPVAAKPVEPEQTDQEWPEDVIKAIIARIPNWTPAQKAEQLKLYKYSHSCAGC